jgi:hypothetical protein
MRTSFGSSGFPSGHGLSVQEGPSGRGCWAWVPRYGWEGWRCALGDYLVLDGDGVVVLPKERAREVLGARQGAGCAGGRSQGPLCPGGTLRGHLWVAQELREVLSEVERLRGGGDG